MEIAVKYDGKRVLDGHDQKQATHDGVGIQVKRIKEPQLGRGRFKVERKKSEKKVNPREERKGGIWKRRPREHKSVGQRSV